MFCSKCGAKIPDNAAFCGSCGAPQKKMEPSVSQTKKEAKQIIVENEMSGGVKCLKCPQCGGNSLQAVSENSTQVKTSGGGYSAGKGCLGWLIFGPFGLLCGSCGQSQKTSVDSTSKTYWVCSDCGTKFRNLDDWKEEINKKEETCKMQIGAAIISLLVGLLFWIITGTGFMMGLLSIAAVCFVGLYFLLKKQIGVDWEAYYALEQKCTGRK